MVYLGIDVSKSTLDIAVVKSGDLVHQEQIANEQKHFRKFLSGLRKSLAVSFSEIIVCMEHTGIYNYRALEVLHKNSIKTCIEPALQIKKSQGMTRGKDDAIDAQRIALYAYRNREELRFFKPVSLSFQKLNGLLTLRDRLIRAKIQLEVPLQESIGYIDRGVVRLIQLASEPAIKSIKRQIKKTDIKIQEVLKQDQVIKTQYDRATSVPGIGQITALNMIINTGGFERIKEAKQFACYSGVAPFKHESGSSIRVRARVSKLANMKMKRLLHLAAMSAIQSSSELKLYYNRKVSEGKNKMSVINAVRNKLINRVFVCINQQRNYENNYQHALG